MATKKKAKKHSVRTPKRTPNPSSLKNLRPAWQKGESGNPGGRPKNDQAAELARAVFENNPDAVYKAMLQAIKKGSPKVFSALADRGYGKVPQRVSLEGSQEAPVSFDVNIRFIDPDPKK